MAKHLVFYDGECGLCDRIVEFLIKKDTEKTFLFAPLQGKTAKRFPLPKELDTLVLVENFEAQDETVHLFGKAALRIFWHLGGVFALLGLFSFLPGFLINWGYRQVARVRYRLFGKVVCKIKDPSQEERFLP